MPATRAEALAAGDPVTAGNHNSLGRCHRSIGDDAVRRVDPDRASDIARHLRGVGCEDRALIDEPAGARVRFAELFQHLHVGRQVDLGAADGTRNQQFEKTGGRQRLKKQPWQLPILLGLIGAGSDGRGHLLRGVKRRLSLSLGHGFASSQRREILAVSKPETKKRLPRDDRVLLRHRSRLSIRCASERLPLLQRDLNAYRNSWIAFPGVLWPTGEIQSASSAAGHEIRHHNRDNLPRMLPGVAFEY